MATVISGLSAVAETEKDNTCTVCMECVPEKKQCVRPCGHMMCAPCDASWQSRGRIQEFKMQRKDKKSAENIMVYMTVSNCPSCRRKDVPNDYHGRSKVSMFHEIQMLTRTLYLSGVVVPMAYEPPQYAELEQVPVTPPVPLMQRIMNIITPPAPPVLRRADAFAPYIPLLVPAPPVLSQVPPSSQATGICSRRMQRLGACHTTRTKLRCTDCQRFLCRSCRHWCVCAA